MADQPCRVVSLRMGQDRAGTTSRDAPFRLTTACGCAADVPQGVPWERSQARRDWLTHTCAEQAAEAVRTA